MDATLLTSSYVWGYHEIIEDLKQKIMSTSMGLEKLRANSSDEIRKGDETISQLVQMINALTQERDEAKIEMQLLLDQMNFHSDDSPPPPPSSRKRQAGVNNSVSSSRTESAIDDVASPGTSNMNVADSGNVRITPPLPPVLVPAPAANDMAEALIGSLVGERTLPEKGKLVQAVIDAGPLLSDLFIAGQLPRWRNPPPILSSNASVLLPLPAAAASGGAILNIRNGLLNPSLMNLGFPSGIQP